MQPPYNHACQIGDPVLRQPARIVEPELIKTKEFQFLINHMVKTMRLYEACGLSAPQIGVPMQIFTAELSETHFRLAGPTRQKAQGLEVIPLKIFINPTLKVVDHGLMQFVEGCVSTVGLEAEVPRYKEVLITGLNADGEIHEWHAKNWAARIAQHELDHLNGVLFTDKMDPTTLSLTAWQEVNLRRGNLQLSFHPI
ncbi:peptide deformylase, mitochondrial-like isoform X2 [Belonocnema kinseyi]|uniref:peptide deformylase, mitochondrial-like isoform X2 n=1 Tax=Belonocnema kinseyi TaxID=2817044 RepID=UPI00143CF542|nr:peptide deformylase, mitochondrial-like isoform X2 [Belonocnema kinseyi]